MSYLRLKAALRFQQQHHPWRAWIPLHPICQALWIIPQYTYLLSSKHHRNPSKSNKCNWFNQRTKWKFYGTKPSTACLPETRCSMATIWLLYYIIIAQKLAISSWSMVVSLEDSCMHTSTLSSWYPPKQLQSNIPQLVSACSNPRRIVYGSL